MEANKQASNQLKKKETLKKIQEKEEVRLRQELKDLAKEEGKRNKALQKEKEEHQNKVAEEQRRKKKEQELEEARLRKELKDLAEEEQKRNKATEKEKEKHNNEVAEEEIRKKTEQENGKGGGNDKLKTVEKNLKEIETKIKQVQGILLNLIEEKENVDYKIKKAKTINEDLMRLLFALDKENMQNINENLKKKKKKIANAVNAIMNYNDFHIDKWEKYAEKNLNTNKEKNSSEVIEDQSPDIVEFVRVKKQGKTKETLHAVVDGVKFYLNHTDKTKEKGYFRCSYYESEKCPARFQAKKVVDIGTENDEWQAENLTSATQHNHQNAKLEAIVAKAKSALRLKVLESPVNKRNKDIYFEFILKYANSLEDEENARFEDYFPTYKRIRATMWRWKKEIIPKAPIQQVDLDILTQFFYSEGGDSLVLGDNTDEHGNRTLTLGDPSTLKSFSESDRLNIDCTYKSAPKPNWASILIIQVKQPTMH